MPVVRWTVFRDRRRRWHDGGVDIVGWSSLHVGMMEGGGRRCDGSKWLGQGCAVARHRHRTGCQNHTEMAVLVAAGPAGCAKRERGRGESNGGVREEEEGE